MAATLDFRDILPFYPIPDDFKAQGPYRLLWFNKEFVSDTEPDSGDRLVLDKDLQITGAVTILKFETEGGRAGHHVYRKCKVTIKDS
ncbi:hypothetical protein K3495_g12271 [Podosphaera aphanis]|nr:hypothetical protein K3495_g12271 [Podosphaera aphanis]